MGFTILIALSLFGIGALLQSALIGLTILKLVGGAYLIWLSIQVWRAPPVGETLAPVLQSSRKRTLFRQGALSAVTNPKGILFFAAFLPQFVDTQRELVLQFVLMAATFVLIEIVTELCLQPGSTDSSLATASGTAFQSSLWRTLHDYWLGTSSEKLSRNLEVLPAL